MINDKSVSSLRDDDDDDCNVVLSFTSLTELRRRNCSQIPCLVAQSIPVGRPENVSALSSTSSLKLMTVHCTGPLSGEMTTDS